MIDVLLCYRNGQKEKIRLYRPLPNPLPFTFPGKKKVIFEHYACLIDCKREEIEYVIYLEEPEAFGDSIKK